MSIKTDPAFKAISQYVNGGFMRTDFPTQVPFEVTRVQASPAAAAVKKDEVRTFAIAGISSQNSQNTVNEKANELEKEIKSLSEDFKAESVELEFSRDDKTGIVVMKLVDSNTGDSLNQIPSKVSLKLAEVFSKLGLHLVDSEA